MDDESMSPENENNSQSSSSSGSQVNDERVAAALGFTNGDEAKARAMVAGDYHDIRIIKGKFALRNSNLFGNFMLFVNTESLMFCNVSLIAYEVVSFYEQLNPAISWKIYFKGCERIARAVTLFNTEEFIPYLSNSLDGYDVASYAVNGDTDNISSALCDIISKFYSFGEPEIVVSIEDSSSLELAEERIPVRKAAPKKAEESQAAPVEDARPEIEKNAQFVVEGKAIVSPLSGKRVADLQKGERILLLLVNRDAASIKVAEALGAFDDKRNYVPMKGKIADIVPVEKIGYYIYCAVAKNVLVKIPEEGNVLIEMADSQKRITIDEVEKKKVDRNLVLYLVLLIGLIVVAGLLIMALI